MPTLLDRLSLKNNGQMNRSSFRKTVMRDLSWLLNCSNSESQLALNHYPLVRKSVVNYGIPPLAGARFSKIDLEEVAAGIQRAIAQFEPRILEKTLKVSVIRDVDASAYNHAQFRIEASFWFEPYPIDMVIRAQWDVETGGVELQENG